MKKHVLLRYLLLLLACISWSPFFMYHDNNLLNNGNWESEKLKIDALMGAQAFVSNPQALAYRALDLGEAHGFNRVVSRETFEDLARAEFRLWTSKESYFYFLFNVTDDSLLALRFDSGSNEVSFNHVNRAGKFLSSKKKAISSPLIAERWSRIQVYFQGARCGISVDGGDTVWFDAGTTDSQRIGFQGGFHSVFVDSVRLYDRTDALLLKDDFDSAYSFQNIPRIPIYFLLFLFFIEILFSPVFHFTSSFSEIVSIGSVSVIIAGFVASIWYLPVLASKHIHLNYQEVFNVSEFQKKRRGLVLERLGTKLSMQDEYSRKILVIGSSQTEGVGAYTYEESFVSRLEMLLNSSESGVSYECYSLGISAYSLHQVLDEYRRLLESLRPDIAILNLAHNDEVYLALDTYEDALLEFISLNRDHGIKLLLVKEAVSPEFSEHGLRAHRIIDSAGSKYNIPVIDTHGYLLEQDRSGFLWWDQVHPTSYGHFLIAEKMYDFMQVNGFVK
jgi:lysophospholipase L1-like esterase